MCSYLNCCVAAPREKEWVEDMDKRISCAVETGWQLNHLKKGDNVVIITGWRSGSGFTNIMRIITVPDRKDTLSVRVLSAELGLSSFATNESFFD